MSGNRSEAIQLRFRGVNVGEPVSEYLKPDPEALMAEQFSASKLLNSQPYSIYTEEKIKFCLCARRRFNIWNESQIDMPRPASGSSPKKPKGNLSSSRYLKSRTSRETTRILAACLSVVYYNIKNTYDSYSIYLFFVKAMRAREMWAKPRIFINLISGKMDAGLKM